MYKKIENNINEGLKKYNGSLECKISVESDEEVFYEIILKQNGKKYVVAIFYLKKDDDGKTIMYKPMYYRIDSQIQSAITKEAFLFIENKI